MSATDHLYDDELMGGNSGSLGQLMGANCCLKQSAGQITGVKSGQRLSVSELMCDRECEKGKLRTYDDCTQKNKSGRQDTLSGNNSTC